MSLGAPLLVLLKGKLLFSSALGKEHQGGTYFYCGKLGHGDNSSQSGLVVNGCVFADYDFFLFSVEG